jgi:hypothetical protein
VTGSIIKTIGVEIEGVTASITALERSLPRALTEMLSSITHDASVESEVFSLGESAKVFLGSRYVRNSPPARRSEREVVGFELVSRPLSLEDISKMSILAMNALVGGGEIFSPRSSIHFHVGFPKDFIFTKSALATGMKIEALFYKIAGMGREYRGSINNSAYARSLRNPPAVRLDSGGYAVIAPEKALESEGFEDFWKCFGVYLGDVQRYHPARYFGVNLLSQLLRGTVEFRHCNFTSDVEDILSVASLSRHTAEFMLKAPRRFVDSLPQIDIFQKNPDGVYHEFLDKFMEVSSRLGMEYPMTDRFENGIRKLIEKTPQPSLTKTITLTHLERFTMSCALSRSVGMDTLDEAPSSGVTNIHNFASQDRSLI